MPMMALGFTRWRRAVMRVSEREKGVIPGCRPAGSNRGMLGQLLDATPRLYIPKVLLKKVLIHATAKKQDIPAKT